MAASSSVLAVPTTAVSTMDRIGPLSQMAIVGSVNRTSRAKSSPLKMGSSSSSSSSSMDVAEAPATGSSTEPFRMTTPSRSAPASIGGGSCSSMLARRPAVESTA